MPADERAPRQVQFNVGKQPSKELDSIPWCKWHAGNQYQILNVVGQGAYGIVCSAFHRVSGRIVAIKKIAPFGNSLVCLRTLRELKLLKFLTEAGVSENVSWAGH
jgi:serine/threonine protein kinase